LRSVLAATAGATFLDGLLLLFRELIREAMMLLEMPLGVRAIETSSSPRTEIRTVTGVKVATGAVPLKISFYGIDPKNMKSLPSGPYAGVTA
jgi:hypothetical protein